MQAINNAGLLNVCNVCSLTGFAPAISYVYNPGAQTIVVTDATVFSAGDGMKAEHVRINDGNGNQLYFDISTDDGSHSFDVSSMSAVSGFTITATIVSNNHAMADLSAYNVGSGAPTSGNLGYINKSQL